MSRMREDGHMTTKTAFLIIIPVAVALLAGAALPLHAAIGLPPGQPTWDSAGAIAAAGIIAVAVALLLRLRAAPAAHR
jgi:hypothetical protein